MAKYNSAFDVAFSIEHDCEDPYDIPVQDIVNAMLERAYDLRKMGGEAIEAFGCYDTYSNDSELLTTSAKRNVKAVKSGGGRRMLDVEIKNSFRIRKQMEFSTAHLTAEDATILRTEPYFVRQFTTGWELVADARTLADANKLGLVCVPVLMHIAIKRGCDAVLLDADGPIYAELPRFEW